MEIESDKTESTKLLINDEDQKRRQLAKQKRKLKKKEKEELKVQVFGSKNLMVKELSYDKKIFLFTDLIIDLDMFTDNYNGRPNKFDAISSWRPPVKITQENNIVHIDLDTSIDGLNSFDQVSKILQSIPNRDAYELGQYIYAYNQSVLKYQEKNQDLMYIYHLISQDQKTKYSLNDYFEDLLAKQMQKAQEFVQEKYKGNKYLSYMIKTRKRNNQVVTKYGYSTDLLNLLGLDNENMYRLLYQNGPIVFYSNQDKIIRLKNSLARRIDCLNSLAICNEDLIYKDQTIITFDDLKFKCDIHMVKEQLNDDTNYYVKQSFLIQLALYDINDSIINEINNHRNQSQNESLPQRYDQHGIYYGLDYESQSEMFIQKYYSSQLQQNPTVS